MPLYDKKQSRPSNKSRVSVSSVLSATQTLIKSVGRVSLRNTLSLLLEKRATKVNTSAPRISTIVDTKEHDPCVDAHCRPLPAIALPYSRIREQDLRVPAGDTQAENQSSVFKPTRTPQVTSRDSPWENISGSRLAQPASPILCSSSTSSRGHSRSSVSVILPKDLKTRRQSAVCSMRDSVVRDKRDIGAEPEGISNSGRRNISMQKKTKLRVGRSRREDPTRRYGAYFSFATFEDLVKEVAQLDSGEPE